MRIGIDMMGGDYAPGFTIRGSMLTREATPDHTELFLVGDRDISGMTVFHTPHYLAIGNYPFNAFREKPDSSVFIGLNPDASPAVLYQYGTIGTIYSKLVHERFT